MAVSPAPVVDGQDDRSPLQQIITRAQLASERMSAKNPNRELLREMAVALVSLARLNADLLQQIAEKPRIVVP